MIGYDNQIGNSTLGGGSWNAAFPQSNLKNRTLSKSAITTTNAVTMTLTATKARCLGVIKTNLPVGATYSLVAGSYSSGTKTTTVKNQDLMFGFPTEQTGTFTLTINNTAPISIGRIFVGTAFQPNLGHSRGADLGHQTQSTVRQSPSGVEFFKKLPIRRKFNFVLEMLTDAESYGIAMDLTEKSDITNEVLLLADYDDENYGYRRNFLGRLSTLSPLKNPYVNINEEAFEVLEIV